jgi:hypothetical protein
MCGSCFIEVSRNFNVDAAAGNTIQVPYISENIKIICAICNKFFRPLSSGAAEEDEIIAAKMKFLSKEINFLKSFVEENNLERKSAKWEKTEDIKDFPFLDEQELRNITCGVYQLKLSPSYIQEYLDGESQILIHKEDPGLIRVKIHSRHISSKQYILWIQFTESTISAWYCKCHAGARVVGVCSHIASVLWYLGNNLLRRTRVSFINDSSATLLWQKLQKPK